MKRHTLACAAWVQDIPDRMCVQIGLGDDHSIYLGYSDVREIYEMIDLNPHTIARIKALEAEIDRLTTVDETHRKILELLDPCSE